MMCYRDMTFCSAECNETDCGRNKEHIPDNLPEWMPVAYSDFSDDCAKYKPKAKND